MLTNWPVSIWYEFLHERIFETEIRILIPIIPRNMFNLRNKKICTKYDKICVFEKCPHENYHGEKKSWAEWPWISLLFSKSMPLLGRVYIGSFFNLYMTLPWWQIDETVNFRNFRKLFTNKCATFFGHYGTLFSNRKNEIKWHGAWSMLLWPSVNVAAR